MAITEQILTADNRLRQFGPVDRRAFKLRLTVVGPGVHHAGLSYQWSYQDVRGPRAFIVILRELNVRRQHGGGNSGLSCPPNHRIMSNQYDAWKKGAGKRGREWIEAVERMMEGNGEFARWKSRNNLAFGILALLTVPFPYTLDRIAEGYPREVNWSDGLFGLACFLGVLGMGRRRYIKHCREIAVADELGQRKAKGVP